MLMCAKFIIMCHDRASLFPLLADAGGSGAAGLALAGAGAGVFAAAAVAAGV